MRICVLVPVYNAERYLKECLDSLLAQTIPVEIFACDDGSTDSSPSILAEYSACHPSLRVFSRQNAGVSATRNFLLDQVPPEAEAVGFVDSDDWIEPTMYEKLVAAMSVEGADVVDCGIRCGDEAVAPSWINVVNKLYRRCVIGSVRFRPGLAFEEDNFFNREVNRNVSSRAVVDEPLYHYRDNPDSATSGLDMRRYVESVTERVRLTLEVFGPGPELARDAYRMMIRKNLKKNADSKLRRELFGFAGAALARFEREYGFSVVGLGVIPRLVCSCCRAGNYLLASILVRLT